MDLTKEVKADLWWSTMWDWAVLGRVFGSIPGNVSRRAKTDVLIVHTTDRPALQRTPLRPAGP